MRRLRTFLADLALIPDMWRRATNEGRRLASWRRELRLREAWGWPAHPSQDPEGYAAFKASYDAANPPKAWEIWEPLS